MAKKNIVFIPNIDLGNNRANSYHFSIKSWKYWCEKNDCVLVEWNDPIFDAGASNKGMDGYNQFPIIYQRDWVLYILDHNKIEYDQVLIVDADTIVHPDCPNFFNETDGKYCGVVNNGCYEWTQRSIDAWHYYMFPDMEPPRTWEYFNTGFIIVNEGHKDFFSKVQEFYLNNKDILFDIRTNKKYKDLQIPAVGQTVINFLVKKFNVEVKLLPECYNLIDLFRKNLLSMPGKYGWWGDDLSNLYKAGYVYHFNAIPAIDPKRTQPYWMERVYNELYLK